MLAPRQPPELLLGSGAVDRLVEHRPVNGDKHLISAQNEHTRQPPRHLERLGLREDIGDLHEPGVIGDQSRLDRLLVDQRRVHRERHPGYSQHRRPRDACRSQSDHLASPARASSRAWTRLITAAAVSSIDRRVTSITGTS